VLVLNELAVQVLASLPQAGPGDAVLTGVDPQRLTVYTRRIFAKLGIHDASFHSLRHTAASWLVMQGVDLYAVGKLLGHKTPRMTQRYAHLLPQYMAEAVGKLDSVFREVMPEKQPGITQNDADLVPVESPLFESLTGEGCKLLNGFGVPDGI